MIYGLVGHYLQVAWIAVPIAILTGSISCFMRDHMVEAVYKAVLAGVIVFFTLRKIPGVIANNPQWWVIGFLGMSVGCLGGMGIGSLLGGACRLAWNPDTSEEDSIAKGE